MDVILKKITKLKIFFYGFVFGLISSIVYVFSGGDVWLSIPNWAWVLFWPGFIAGEYSFDFFYNHGLDLIVLIISFLSISIYYGILALLINYIVSTLRKKCTEQ
ncbi:MAG: hypothetical protein KAI43_10535 [Candidatus Aureabacteria bacterium]|nr:hypothetical protein [Candidatus Auribacterota bacterium]